MTELALKFIFRYNSALYSETLNNPWENKVLKTWSHYSKCYPITLGSPTTTMCVLFGCEF